MGTQFLIDTSAVIKYINSTFSEKGMVFIDGFINSNRMISFVSEIELQSWNPANPDDVIVYQQFIAESNITGINAGIIAETIEIRKKYKLKLPDAIIAATSLQLDLTLVADNDQDFMKVPSLKYVNPRTL
jgi:predicted nucleic acid-binding protein